MICYFNCAQKRYFDFPRSKYLTIICGKGVVMKLQKFLENAIVFVLLLVGCSVIALAMIGGSILSADADTSNLFNGGETTVWQSILPAIWFFGSIVIALLAIALTALKTKDWSEELADIICALLKRKFPRTFSVLV